MVMPVLYFNCNCFAHCIQTGTQPTLCSTKKDKKTRCAALYSRCSCACRHYPALSAEGPQPQLDPSCWFEQLACLHAEGRQPDVSSSLPASLVSLSLCDMRVDCKVAFNLCRRATVRSDICRSHTMHWELVTSVGTSGCRSA